MQTIVVPWWSDDESRSTILGWQAAQAVAVRSAYANAPGRSESELRNLLKARFPDHPLGSWALHCATREGMRLRVQVPSGKLVFGGRSNLERRRKGLISGAAWKALRASRPIEIVGDRTRWGNRHFVLSQDARTCTVSFLKQEVVLDLPKMSGKAGKLLPALARLADACEISLQFSLGARTLSISFDPMDLRKLPAGHTLESLKALERGSAKSRGRPRKDPATHYAAHRIKPIPAAKRPVHPEWREAIPMLSRRAIGIDLNPEWIGLSVVEVPESANPRDAYAVRILDHRLHRINIPADAPREQMAQAMAWVARQAISMARAWNVATIFHESGLGKLRSGGKSKKLNHLINFWSRNALLGGLGRRCALTGITLTPIWGGYSSTIGNMLFALPDACASAAEIARRGIASLRKEKDCLPAVPPMVHTRRWKDGDVLAAMAKAMANADSWQAVHRAIKSAQDGSHKRSSIGYRRLHPSALLMVPGRFDHDGRSYAVDRLGTGKGVSCSARPVLSRTVRNSSDRVLNH